MRLMPVSRSTMAGILLLGLIVRKSGANRSSLVMSIGCAVGQSELLKQDGVDYDAKRNGFKQSGFACLFQAL